MEFRLAAFVGILIIMMSAEAIWSRRKRLFDPLMRWPGNFGVAMLGNILIMVLLPVTAVGVALEVAARGTGLFNVLAVPPVIAVPVAMILLDLLIYWQHRLFHAIPVLWRLHRMHHTDLEIDASTALRFHPFELVVSMLIKLAAIALLGPPALAVMLFEITLNACAIFNHANVKLPLWLDALVRRLIVTPDMHRVHHSSIPDETNSNFGFCLSVWDRWFGSYTAQPQLGHEAMNIGLAEYRDRVILRPDRMLADPFVSPSSGVSGSNP